MDGYDDIVEVSWNVGVLRGDKAKTKLARKK